MWTLDSGRFAMEASQARARRASTALDDDNWAAREFVCCLWMPGGFQCARQNAPGARRQTKPVLFCPFGRGAPRLSAAQLRVGWHT